RAIPRQRNRCITGSRRRGRERADFARWATEAGLPPRCRLHGLKKGGMRRLAESGHMSLWRSPATARSTPNAADRKHLADQGMDKKRREELAHSRAKREHRTGKPG